MCAGSSSFRDAPGGLEQAARSPHRVLTPEGLADMIEELVTSDDCVDELLEAIRLCESKHPHRPGPRSWVKTQPRGEGGRYVKREAVQGRQG